jgi:hypothetical protein
MCVIFLVMDYAMYHHTSKRNDKISWWASVVVAAVVPFCEGTPWSNNIRSNYVTSFGIIAIAFMCWATSTYIQTTWFALYPAVCALAWTGSLGAASHTHNVPEVLCVRACPSLCYTSSKRSSHAWSFWSGMGSDNKFRLCVWVSKGASCDA